MPTTINRENCRTLETISFLSVSKLHYFYWELSLTSACVSVSFYSTKAFVVIAHFFPETAFFFFCHRKLCEERTFHQSQMNRIGICNVNLLRFFFYFFILRKQHMQLIFLKHFFLLKFGYSEKATKCFKKYPNYFGHTK